jgi:D-glycero-D-manno-heptose 1,7-bisphosphate phosphatase
VARAVFLDRDDTLIQNRGLPAPASRPPRWRPGDLCDPQRVRLLPGVLEACARLKRAGYLLVVVSNQSLVGRGVGTIEKVEATNRRLAELLTDGSGALLDAAYFCPNLPEGVVPRFTGDHPWRKPRPGMILRAAEDLGIDLAASWLVGDQPRDVQAGVTAGLAPKRCILLGGRVPDLAAAADVILSGGSDSGD